MNRLSQYPELEDLLKQLDEAQAQQLILSATEEAIRVSNLDDQQVATLLEKAKTDKLSDQEISMLEELVQKIEDPYLEALGRDEQIGKDSKLMSLFKQARAIQSLVEIGHDKTEDALYEALNAGVSANFIKDCAHRSL